MDKLIDILNQWGIWGLIITAFIESSVFIVPPDVLLIPMSIAKPEKALLYAFLCTLFSVLGGIFGYWLGKKLGRPFLLKFAKEKHIKKAEDLFDKHGGTAVVFAGLTPVPYKVFTILGGVIRMPIKTFIIASIIGRGIRFLLEAIIVIYFGDKALDIITEYGSVITLGLGIFVILIYFIYKKIKKK